MVGASFPVRTLANLIQNAARLVGKPFPPSRATMEEGQQWLAAEY